MADKKISELNQVVEVGLNDMLLVVQDGTSKRASAQQLSNLLNVDLTLGELSDVSVSDIQDGQTILWDELANKYRPADIPNAASINNILNEIIAANTSISDVVSSIQTVVGTYDTQITDLGSRITSVDSYYSIVTGATNAAVASVESHVNTVSAANSTTNARVTSVDNYFLNQVSVLSGSLVSVDSRVNTVDSRVTSVMGEVSNLTSVELAARTSLASSINTVSGNLTSLQGTVNTIQSQVNTVSAAVTSVNNSIPRNLVSLADVVMTPGAGTDGYSVTWNNSTSKFNLTNVGLTDGDKGDITVSAGVWTIDDGVVSNSKLANNAVTTSIVADNQVTNAKLTQVATATFKGRTTAGTGNVEDLTATQARSVLAVGKRATDLASASTTNLGDIDGDYVHITGTTTITSFGTTGAVEGMFKHIKFDGALILTHGSNLLLPSSANITTAGGDRMGVVYQGSSVWRVMYYTKGDGTALVAPISGFTFGTAQTATGSAVDFTGIPSTARIVLVTFDALLSSSGTSPYGVQIGDSGGVETSGYNSFSTNGTLTTSAFIVSDAGILGSDNWSGSIILTNITGNQWTCSGSLAETGSGVAVVAGGRKTLSATLDRVRVMRIGGGNFTSGTINIAYI